MKESEKLLVKCRTSHSRRNKYYQSFKSLRQKIDKKLRQTEWAYNKKLISYLEDLTNKNPREFWNKIKCMGPKRPKMPLSVHKNNSDELTDDAFCVKQNGKK